MNYITTNIRIPEDDYLRIKAEAAKKRKSFAEIVRQKIQTKSSGHSMNAVEKILKQTRERARKNSKELSRVDGVTILREIRYKKA